MPGIVDPTTGNILTVGEAIQLRLLDVRSGEILLISGERMSLEKAAKLGMIDPFLAEKLLNHLEAAQNEIIDAENGNGDVSKEKRVKVTATTEIRPSNSVKTIADAIKDETVDPIMGVYKLPDGNTITITDAYQRGLIVQNESVKIKSIPLCLADAISHGLVDTSGWVIDRNAYDKFRLDSAIANNLIVSNIQEVVDTRNDTKVTVERAIDIGLLNAKTGRYINPVTKEKLSFIEARNRQLIVRPMTLKDVCELNLIDSNALIMSPTRKCQLTIPNAIQNGILDGDKIKSISNGDSTANDLLTLNEAIQNGIVSVNGNVFKNATTGESMTIQDAVNRGLISSVRQKSLFDIEAFKDINSSDFLSLNDAISKDIIVKVNENFKLNTGKNHLITLDEGIENNLVRGEVIEMLSRRVGVFNENGKEYNVLDLVLNDLIDPKSGYLIDSDKNIIPLNQAIDRKIITAEGALLLSSLLNITLTTETLTKYEKRYITIANTIVDDYSSQTSSKDSELSLSKAIEENVFDPDTGIYTIPNTDRLVRFEECIQLGLINPESMTIIDPKYKEEITVHRALEKDILDTTGQYRTLQGRISMKEGIKHGFIILNDKTPLSISNSESEIDTIVTPHKSGFSTPEPLEIEPGVIYDPSTALVIDTKTGKSKNILEALKENLVDSDNVKIIDSASGQSIPIGDAIKNGLVTVEGEEIVNNSGERISLMDAVKTGMLVVAGAPLVAAVGAINSIKMVFDPSTNENIPIELAFQRGLVSRDEISDFSFSENRSQPKSTGISLNSSFDIPTPHDISASTTPSKMLKQSQFIEPKEIESSEIDSHVKQYLSEELLQLNDPSCLDVVQDTQKTQTDSEPDNLINKKDVNIPKNVEQQKHHKEEETNKLNKTPTETCENNSSSIPNKDIDSVSIFAINDNEVLADTQHQKKSTSSSLSLPNHDDEFSKTKISNEKQEIKTPIKVSETSLKQIDNPTNTQSSENESSTLEKVAKGAAFGLMAIVGAPVLAGITAADKIKDSINKLDFNTDNTTSNKLNPNENMASSLTHKTSDMKQPLDSREHTKTGIDISEQLDPSSLEKLGAYDKRSGSFLDPITGNKVPFDDFIYNCGVFNPEKIFVKDFSNNNFVPLAVALEKVLIDKNTGIMVEAKTGKRVPFFECMKREWIIQKEPSTSQYMSLREALDSGLMDEASGKVAVDGILLPISEAISSGVIDPSSVSLRDSSGEIIPLSQAVENGIVDLKRGNFIDPKTGEIKNLDTLFREGDLLEGIACPLSLEAVIKSDLYDNESRKIKNGDILIDIQDAVDEGIIDPNISLVKDSMKNEIIPLQQALNEKLIDNGYLKISMTGECVPLDKAVEKNLISTKSIKMSLIDAIVKEFYKEDSQKILNPMSGCLQSVKDAIKSEFIDISTTLIFDKKNNIVISVQEAIDNNLLDLENGILTNPELNLKNAYHRGYILNSKKPISLSDAIVRNIYNPNTGKFIIENDEERSLDECIRRGEISPVDLIVHDPKSNEIMSVGDAIKMGLIDSKMGRVNEPLSGEKLTFNEAIDRGIIIISKRKCSLPDAVFKGLYDPNSGIFSNTKTREKLPVDIAIKRGFIDPQSTIVNLGGKIVPFELSIESGMVDTKRGTISDEFGNKIDFREAFERGILVEVRKPIGLYEALLKGIYDEETGLFMDTQTGKGLSLEQAINANLIDNNSVQIKDPSNEEMFRDVSLVDAIKSGLIDDKSNIHIDSRRLTLRQAFDLGILCDSKAPISIQRAIHQGIYDNKTGKIIDLSYPEKKMTLHEAMRRWIINPQMPCYFNENDECLLSLSECCRLKMIDRHEGVFKEPGSDIFIPLNEALDLGLIVDIEKGDFELYDMLAMKLYDTSNGKFFNPSNGMLISMADAIQENVISLASSLIKETSNGKYVKLNDAIEMSIIDVINGRYVYSDGKKIDLQEARRLGLIVSSKKLLSLEKAVKMKLCKVDSGKIVDPSTNNQMNLKECIDYGLIDGATTVLKDYSQTEDKTIKNAIDEGMIDIEKGHVTDPETKSTCNFDVSFSKGLLASVNVPITGKKAPMGREESFENILKSSEQSQKVDQGMSLEEAINSGIIDAEKTLIKDTKSGQFRPLSEIITDNPTSIDLTKKIPSSIDASAKSFTFDENNVIYTREPESFEDAVESSHLNLSNGMYENPECNLKCNLKEAITNGLIDPESALIKDGAKNKLIRLPEAFRKGLIDSDKFNVVDTNTSKLLSLEQAVSDAIIVTPKTSLDLLDALNFNLYDCESGSFHDPFTTTKSPITLQDAISKGLIDPSSIVVRDLSNSEITPLTAAICSGLIDPINGRLMADKNSSPIDFVKARDKGLLMPAEKRVSNSVEVSLSHVKIYFIIHTLSCFYYYFFLVTYDKDFSLTMKVM